jgi:molybdopterin/thiamine biosynthesis adenylyltransferase/rhodanese-related sulfurtransferase
MFPDLLHDEILRYSRHLLIPEVGLDGQRKLKASSVLVVGTGGLGSPITLYLAAAGIGHIGIVDYDVVELSNLQRQVIHGTSTIGIPKVESARERILDINPKISIDSYNTVLNSSNAREIADGYQILVDGTDNFPTRYLMNDLAVLTEKPFVYGAVFRFEGQVSVFDAQHGPCYRCMFAVPPDPGIVPSCAEGGVFGVMPGIIGTIQATEVIKLILGIGEPLIGSLLIVDGLESSFQKVTIPKNPECLVCGSKPLIKDLIDYEEFCGSPIVSPDEIQLEPGQSLSPQELSDMIKDGDVLRIIDVRSPVEQQVSVFPGAENIPLEQLREDLAQLDREQHIVLVCRTGIRSARAVKMLQKAGFGRVKNLKGGINAWAKEIDSSIRLY